MANSTGTIHESNTLFFRIEAGTATSPEGNKYELSIGVSGNAPIVHSNKSGQWFTLTWNQIIRMAIEAGIDVKIKKKRGSKNGK